MSSKPPSAKSTPVSSRLNVRDRRMSLAPSKWDRLRRRRDGTPEKSLTPSQEPDELATPTKNVIWNQEIQDLQIKPDDLQKVWPPRPPSSEKKLARPVPISVQKKVKVTEQEKPKSRMVSIAKPAPPDAEVKPMDYSGYAGPRYDAEGHVVMHSLLGTYEDFHREAVKQGDLLDDMPCPGMGSNSSEAPSLKYERKKRTNTIHLNQNENNALRNWQLKMMERKRQQGYISKLLQKAPEDLAMNQSDAYRQVQEERYLIDRTIPKVDYGKGYRVGSEFWHQQEPFGDDVTGLHMTLTQSQRGYPPPVEHIGVPNVVKQEKGSEWMKQKGWHLNYPWHHSEFLKQRTEQLQPYMDEMVPFKPDYNGLQVMGSNRPFMESNIDESDEKTDKMKTEEEDDDDFNNYRVNNPGLAMDVLECDEEEAECDETKEVKEPVFGPSLLFGGQAARWMGDSFSLRDEVGIEARVTFEALTGDRVTSFLELINDGTTSIYYDWKKMSKENPFELVQAQVQRFYFNNSSGVILPGETLKFPFVFKSPNAGVFTEQWKLETRPVVCGGADLLVTLRGVALQEDKYKYQREQLEKELVHRQAEQVVSYLLYEIINGIRSPERPRSPVDAYITEEEIFRRNNPGMHYNHELVAQLQALYSQLFDEEAKAENVWSLSVPDLQETILALEDDDGDERKEKMLHQMNEIVGKLSYIPVVPLQQQLQCLGHQLFSEAIDKMVGASFLLRHTMGLPDREHDDLEGDIRDSRKGTRASEKTKVEATKDKGKAGQKDTKAAKGKEAKADSKGKSTPGPSKKSSTPVKASPAPAPSSSSLGTAAEKEAVESSSSHPSSPEPNVTLGMSDAELAAVEKLYSQNLMTQMYEILGDMVDRMDETFTATKESNSNNL